MLHLLASDRDVVASPMSYGGAAERSWLLVRRNHSLSVKVFVAVPVTMLVLVWWTVITLWGFASGVLTMPSHITHRGSGKPKLAAAQHRDLLGAIALAGKRS
jgi:hypothetical protein